MTAGVQPIACATTVAAAALACAALCVAARRHRGPWTIAAANALVAVATFLPAVAGVGLFALLPETRGHEPEDLWPGIV